MTKVQNPQRPFWSFEFRIFNLFRILDLEFRIFERGFTPPLQEFRKRNKSDTQVSTRYSSIRSTSARAGFTMIEVVVMMAIIVSISGIVLINFTGLHEGTALNRGVRELALAIRKIQNTSLAVTQVDTRAGPKIPSAVGIRLTRDASVYILFADLTRDNKYDPSVVSEDPDARTGDDPIFQGGVKVKSLTYRDALNNPQTTSVAHIIFAAPEAAVFIGDQDGNTLGDTLVIELTSLSGQLTKSITVRTSGQVSIR